MNAAHTVCWPSGKSAAQMAMRWAAIALAVLAQAVPTAVLAEDAATFYTGKTLTMVVGYPPGGSPDIYARIVAQHIGASIPGSPRVVVLNMPGAGSVVAANHLFNVAARDGTILGVISPSLPLQAKLGLAEAKYDATKFNWLGRTGGATNVMIVWSTSKITSIEDAKRTEVVYAGSGATTITLYPSFMNKVMGTKFKIIVGYPGSAQTFVAMERGEVEGTNASWETLKAVHEDWIKEGKIRMLAQHGLTRNPELPNLPTSIELANPQDRDLMRIIMSPAEVGKAYFTTPEVPADRVEALRRAFDRMVKVPGFVADVLKIKGEVAPMTGEDMQKLIGELDTMPANLRDRAAELYNSPL